MIAGYLSLLAWLATAVQSRVQCVDGKNSSKNMLQLAVGYNDITEFDISTLVDTTEAIGTVTYKMASSDVSVLPTIEDMVRPTRTLAVQFPEIDTIDQVLSPGGDSIVYIYNKSTVYILRVDSAFDHKVSFFKINLEFMAREKLYCMDADYYASRKRLLILCKPESEASEHNAFIFTVDLVSKQLEKVIHVPFNKQGFNISKSAQLAIVQASGSLGIHGTVLIYNQRHKVKSQYVSQHDNIQFVQFCTVNHPIYLVMNCKPEYVHATFNASILIDYYTDILVMTNSSGFFMVGSGSKTNGTLAVQCYLSFYGEIGNLLICTSTTRSLSNSNSVASFMNYPYILLINYQKLKLKICVAKTAIGLVRQVGECKSVSIPQLGVGNLHVRDAILSDNLIHLSLTHNETMRNIGYINVNYWNKQVSFDLEGYAGVALGRSLVKSKYRHTSVKVSLGGPPLMTLNQKSCHLKSCEFEITALDYEDSVRCYLNISIVRNYSTHIEIVKSLNPYRIDILYRSHYLWPIKVDLLQGNALDYKLELNGKLTDLASIDMYHTSNFKIEFEGSDGQEKLFFQVAAGPNYLIGLTVHKELVYYQCNIVDIDIMRCKLRQKSTALEQGKKIDFGLSGTYAGGVVYLELKYRTESKWAIIHPEDGFLFPNATYKQIYSISAMSGIMEENQNNAMISISSDIGLEIWVHKLLSKNVVVYVRHALIDINKRDTYMARAVHFVVDPILNNKVLLVVTTTEEKQVWLQYLELLPPYTVIRSMKLPYYFDSVYACPLKNKLLIAGKKISSKDWEVFITTHWFNSLSLQRIELNYILENDTAEELVCMKSVNLAAIVSKNNQGRWKSIVLYTDQMASKQIHSVIPNQEEKPLIFESSQGMLHLSLKGLRIDNCKHSYKHGPLAIARFTGPMPPEAISSASMNLNVGGLAKMTISNSKGVTISEDTYVNVIFQNPEINVKSLYPPDLSPGTFSLDRLVDVRGSVEEVSLTGPNIGNNIEFSPRTKFLSRYTDIRNKYPVIDMAMSGKNKLIVVLYDDQLDNRRLTFLMFDGTSFLFAVHTKVSGHPTDSSAFTNVHGDTIILFSVPRDNERSQYLIKYVVVSPTGHQIITEFDPIFQSNLRPRQVEIVSGKESIMAFVRIESKLLVFYLPASELMNKTAKWEEIGEYLSCDGFSYAIDEEKIIVSYYSRLNNQVTNLLFDISGLPYLLMRKLEVFSRYSNSWIDCLKITRERAVCVLSTHSAYLIEYQLDFEDLKVIWRYLEKYNDTEILAVSLSKNFIVGYAVSTTPGNRNCSLQIWRRYYGEWTSRTIRMYSLIKLENPANRELYRKPSPFSLITKKHTDNLGSIVAIATNNVSAPIDFYEISVARVTIKPQNNKLISINGVNLTFRGLTTTTKSLSTCFTLSQREEPPAPKQPAWYVSQFWVLLVGVLGTSMVILILILLYCCAGEKELSYEEYVKILNESDSPKDKEDVRFSSFSEASFCEDTIDTRSPRHTTVKAIQIPFPVK